MKFLTIALSFLLCFSCQKSCNKSASTEVLRIGTNANFPPFESVDKNGNLEGFDIDVGNALANEMHRKAKFIEFDLDALILALKQGQIDIILSGMSITASRQQEITLIPYQGKPLTDVSFLFWQEEPTGIDSLESLASLARSKGLSITVQTGHFLEGFLKDAGLEVKALPGPPEQLLDIKYNKSLAAALDTPSAKALRARDNHLKMLTIPLPKSKWDLGNGIGIKKENLALTREIEQALSALKANHTLETLETKWLTGSNQ